MSERNVIEIYRKRKRSESQRHIRPPAIVHDGLFFAYASGGDSRSGSPGASASVSPSPSSVAFSFPFVDAFLAFLVTLVVWVIEMALFGIARNRLAHQGDPASWGNANWIVLGALVSLFLGFFSSLCGVFGNYRARRATY